MVSPESVLGAGYITVWKVSLCNRYKDAFVVVVWCLFVWVFLLSSQHDLVKAVSVLYLGIPGDQAGGVSGNATLISVVIHRRKGPPRALWSVRGQVPAKTLK